MNLRSPLWTLCLLAVLLLPAAGRGPAPDLLLGQDFPDPGVVPGEQVAFATAGPAGSIPMASSASGAWTITGDALAARPSWAAEGTSYWAPDVSRRADGSWLMYFSATAVATGFMCVGAAVAGAVTGPYRPAGDRPLVCRPGDGSDIDPQAFTDTGGTTYLLYKSLHGPGGASTIWLQQVDPAGLTLVGGRRTLLRVDAPAEQGVIEAPCLVKTPGGYTLLYSAGKFTDSSYHTSYAVSAALAGPYRKAGDLLTTGGLGSAVDGPGGADVAGDRIYFHGWLPGHRARGLYTLPIHFESTRPVLG
ncbi:glycoside hydrolase family 43 protein [Amycolatopsis sp., V23-08]|uniref:Glycoside hydrolase family 43 protein n=1 Tax=Amycolatopsis heterodermiae TaxID=3110235 RepID=A0ABU5RBM8_9PSEU|nr:glycoside hydrolase family 43 protein [Amycolatopsis sp., V23-08]MEA5363179.1 glycoside hydrolase family 43 protein [Amycolatopsis sp., V23-08]